MITKEKALANDQGPILPYDRSNCTLFKADYKIYPPYGRKIDEIRKRGMVPKLRVIVSTRWEIGKAYPRIVITGEIPIRNLEFRYLAGLAVQIVHFNTDNCIGELIDAIRYCKPRQLCVFNMDNVKTGLPALKIIRAQHIREAENA